MAARRRLTMYETVAVRAVQEALYQRLLHESWDVLKDVFARPDIREAEAKIMRAVAEAFSPNGKGIRRRARRGTHDR